ncbi:MAG: hypothetical protein ACLFWF_05970 [Alphaproteobacteria bacterium]
MAEEPENNELAGTEHGRTWSFFINLTKWASLATLWIVGMLVAVFGLNLPVLPPFIVLSLLVAAVAYLLR